MAFDPNDYLSARFQALNNTDKQFELLEASKAKVAGLKVERDIASKRDAVLASKRQADEASWVNQLDVNPNSVTGALVNTGASLVYGAGRVAGHVASLMSNLGAAADESGHSQEEIDAFNRVSKFGQGDMAEGLKAQYFQTEQGKQDKALLDRQMNNFAPTGSSEADAIYSAQQEKYQPVRFTVGETLAQGQKLRETSRKINDFFDVHSIVHQGNRDKLNADLGKDFGDAWNEVKTGWNDTKDGSVLSGSGNVIAGLSRLIYNAGEAAVTNPRASVEYMAENAPQLALGAAGRAGKFALGASNIGYAADEYSKGIEEYRKFNEGALPSNEERKVMAFRAASLALAEQLGDVAQLHGIGKVAGSIDDVAATGFKQGLKRSIASGAEGLVTEAATEGYQTYQENMLSNRVIDWDKGTNATQVDPQQVYTAATIGGIAGAGMTGGGHAVNEIRGNSEAAAQNQSNAVQRSIRFADAVANNDTSVYLDPEQKAYDPAKAVGVLLKHAQLETTTPEVKKTNLEQANKIIEDLHAERATVQEKLDTLSPEVQQSRIEAMEAKLATIDPAETDRIAQYETMIESSKADLAEQIANSDPKEVSKLEEQVAKLDKTIELSEFRLSPLLETAAPSETLTKDEVKSLVSEVNDPATSVEQATTTAGRVINLSMRDPSSVDPAVMQQMADNTKLNLSTEQREYLRVFSDAQMEVLKGKNMDTVNKEVFMGGPGKLGIVQHRERIREAFAAGNKPMLDARIAQMDAFLKTQENKLAAAQEILARIETQGEGQIMANAKTGTWRALPVSEQVDPAVLKRNGGLEIHPIRSKGIVAGMASAVRALKASQVETQAMLALAPQGGLQSVSPTQTTPSNNNQLTTTTEEGSRLENKEDPSSPASPEATPKKDPKAKKTLEESRAAIAKQEAVVAAAVAKEAERKAAKEAQASEVQQKEEVAQVEPATESVKDTQEAATQTNDEQSVNESVSEEGKDNTGSLSVFKQYTKDIGGKLNDKFRELNLVAQFLKQSNKSEKHGTTKPLAAVADFLTQWSQGKAKPSDYVNNKAFSDEQKSAIKNMYRFLSAFVDKFGSNFAEYTGNADFMSQDMMQYLYIKTADGNLSLDENIKTAAGYAAYNRILNSANSPAFMTKDQVAGMHGFEENQYVSPEGMKRLSVMESFQDKYIFELGDVAVKALGIQEHPNSPMDILPRLKAALGAHIMDQMEKDGFITRHAITVGELSPYFTIAEKGEFGSNPFEGFDPDTVFNYIQFNRDGVKLTDDVRLIRDANVGSKGVVDLIFGNDEETRIAQNTPQKFVQKVAQKTDRVISKFQKKVVEQTMQTPHKVIPAMWNLLEKLGDQAILNVAGFREVDDTRVHKANRRSIEAQNNNLTMQLYAAQDMIGTDIDQEFYVEQSVWRNFRAGFMNQSLNQQTSKIHRFLFARPDWTVTIDPNNEAQVNEYLISVAMNMGLKTDQQRNAKTLELFQAELAKDNNLLKAVELIQSGLLEDSNVFDEQKNIDLVQSVAADREGMMTLQAMVSYAEYLHAKGKPFQTTLLVGADGKTNGPILSVLALGAAASVGEFFKTLNRGGMFSTEEGQATHFSEYFEGDEAMDLYEDLGSHIIKSLKGRTFTAEEIKRMDKDTKKQYQPFTQQQIDALQVITKPLMNGHKTTKAGRNLVKTPLTSFAFGSSLNTSVANMQETFITSIYEMAEKLASGKETKVSLKELINAMNVVMNHGDFNSEKLNPNMDMQEFLDNLLSRGQELALRKGFKKIIGMSVKTTMNSYFATFIQRRQDMNGAVQAAYSAYEAAFADARIKLMEKLMDEGQMAFRMSGKGKTVRTPMHDLTVEQERSLREQYKDMLPIMHTDYSLAEKNLNGGLMMAKSEVRMNYSPLYYSKTAMKNVKSRSTKGDYLDSKAMTRVEKDPGVAGAAYAMHSSDSSIMHHALNKVKQALNVHDEISTSVDQIGTAAQAINQAVVDTFLHYSPAREAVNMLERLTTNLAEHIKAGRADKELTRNLFNSWIEQANKNTGEDGVDINTVADYMMVNAFNNAVAADTMRLQAIANMASVDQYTWEGGQFAVTEEIRAQAKEMLSKLETEPSQKFKDAMAFLTETAQAQAEEKSSYPDWAGIDTSTDVQDQATDEVPSAVNKSILGTPGVIGETLVEQIADVIPEVAAEVAKGTDMIEAINKQEPAKRSAALQAIVDAAAKIERMTPFGELGMPSMESNANLVAAFEAAPDNTLSVKEVIALVAQELTGASNVAAFNNKLLTMLSRANNPNMKVRMVTSRTTLNEATAAKAERSRGWYHMDERGVDTINVLSPEFKYSGLTAELLMHELTHAAVAALIENEQHKYNKSDNKKYTSEALELINELENLRRDAQDYVIQNKLKQHIPAISNLQEFVAWGMTNLDFQKEVISKLKFDSKTSGNKLVNAMQKFISAITQLLFRSANRTATEVDTHGMSVLIANVSGLMYQAATENKAKRQINLSQQQGPDYTSATYSTENIFDALESDVNPVSEGFSTQLRGLLQGIVSKLHGDSFGSLKAERMQYQPLSADEVYEEAIITGLMPFASASLAAGFPISEQEAYVMEQVEVVMQEALKDSANQTSIVYTELVKLYNEAQSKLTPADFQSQEQYDFVFNKFNVKEGKSDYISRFVALGLANEMVNKALKFDTAKEVKPKGKTFLDRLGNMFDQVLEFFYGKWTKTYDGQKADQKLLQLVDQLVGIEAKKRLKLTRRDSGIFVPIEDAFNKGSKDVRDKLEEFGKSAFIQGRDSVFIRAAGNLVSAYAGDRLEAIVNTANRIRDRKFRESHGLAAGIINEIRGTNSTNMKSHVMLREVKLDEGQRKDLITHTGNMVRESFANEGKDLTEDQMKSITRVVLRLDMASLIDDYSLADIAKMTLSPSELNKEITKLEDMLKQQGKFHHYFINSAKALGYAKVTGEVTVDNLQQNAYAIAKLFGTSYTNRMTEEMATAAEPIIDKLITMYGMRHTSEKERLNVHGLMVSEAARQDKGNGIELVMKLHKKLQADSLERLFGDNKTQMMKGYTPEIYNPSMEVLAMTEKEGKDYEARGYSKSLTPLPQDPANPGEQKFLYTLRDGGLQPHLTGLVSYTGRKSKGSAVHNGNMSLFSEEGQENIQQMMDITAAKKKGTNAMFSNSATFDPSKANPKGVSRLASLLNEKGEVVNYRYLMQENTKDLLLQRDNKFHKVLGVMHGSIYDKETTKVQNKKVVQLLKDQYKEDFAEKAESFLTISPRSDSAELREIYALLPQEMKQEIRNIWGKDEIKVRVDLMDVTFGYRKLSLATIFDKERHEMHVLEAGLVELTKLVFKEKAQLRVRQGEAMWQAVVKEAKDNIVTKSGATLLGNMMSNVTLLYAYGVKPLDMLHHHKVAIKGAMAYKKESAELFVLEQQIATGYIIGDKSKIENEIMKLKDSIARNPVAVLIAEGLMPSIVEDVEANDTDYTFKSRLTRKIEEKTSFINPHIMTAIKNVYMTHDTKGYKAMSYATQLSDFVARYTLYQHMTTRRKDAMSHTDAVQLASEAFVNYDIPSHRTMQYANDVGILWFTKYYLRIQKVIAHLYRDNPGRVLSLLAFEHYIHNISSVTDSSFMHKLHNPFTMGALKYPSTIDDIAAVKMLLSPLR